MTPARMTDAQYARLTSGARPRQPRAKKAPKLQSEADLLKQVLGWLKAKGVFHWRANSGSALRRGRRGRTVPVAMNPAGTPDVLAVLPVRLECERPGVLAVRKVGVLLGIEVKAKGGRLRPSQLAWKENAERQGVRYLEIRSLQELIDALAEEGVS